MISVTVGVCLAYTYPSPCARAPSPAAWQPGYPSRPSRPPLRVLPQPERAGHKYCKHCHEAGKASVLGDIIRLDSQALGPVMGLARPSGDIILAGVVRCGVCGRDTVWHLDERARRTLRGVA